MRDDAKIERLRKACEKARLAVEDVIEGARAGDYQIFDTENAVAVTSVSVSGPFRVCYINLVAGTLEGIREVNRLVDAFALGQGCTHIRTTGRPGFAKHQEQLDPGFKPIGTVYEKAL